ncbi:MAG TPA: PQQ-dependent sugar dehydrogenase, partial [Candidatus Limnocylindrales bacterium]
QLQFGPDGNLYIGIGDGDLQDAPKRNAQNLDLPLGKILRIHVDGGAGYTVPRDNPFAAPGDPGMDEIWAYGFRNPWRFSFDRATGDLFIADVGQDRVEEVNAEPAGAGGRNYGWKLMEGRVCFQGRGCDQAGLTLPVATYNHQLGCSVTGGYVYRGAAVPALVGSYLYSDYCSGTLWALDAATAIATGSADPVVLLETDRRVTGFGEDEAGEVYLVTAEGEILRVDAAR